MSYRRALTSGSLSTRPRKTYVRFYFQPGDPAAAGSPYKTVKEQHLKQSEALAGGL
jgi:hypothetical protein